jgi:hypothetical protein
MKNRCEGDLHFELEVTLVMIQGKFKSTQEESMGVRNRQTQTQMHTQPF